MAVQGVAQCVVAPRVYVKVQSRFVWCSTSGSDCGDKKSISSAPSKF